MIAMRWPGGQVRCPTCGSENVTYLEKARLFKCYAKHPRQKFSLKVGTVFEDSPLGLDKWLTAIWLIANAKNGISSYELSRHLGLAEKNRLPLEDVINTLQQIQHMIRDCGRQIQGDAGIENADGDFGIELIGGPSGLIFRKGSLKTAATITQDIPHGILAINTLIDTTDLLEKRQKNIFTPDYAEPILRRLPRVSEIQRENRTELHLSLSQNRQILNSSKLGERGRETLKRFEAPDVGIESITLYGRLRELRDKSRAISDEENRGHFWGELQEDSGRIWRIRFKDRDESKVLKLFRKQVAITGDATYFRTQAPRVDAADIDEDVMPDYLAAYDRFNTAYRDVFGDRDTEDILDEARG